MGGPHRSGEFLSFLFFHVLCVLLTLPEVGSQNSTACARWCPPNSSCVNGTSCRCLPGFSSSSGSEIFTSLLESCDDINECGPPLTVSCGQSADCKNTEGSYYCMCIPGYALVSGAPTFRNESENMCQGISGLSVTYLTWTNVSGNPESVKAAASASNSEGNYTCQCPPGLELNPEGPEPCKDVNECALEETHATTPPTASTTWADMSAAAAPAGSRFPGSPNGPNNTICEEIFATWTAPPGIKSQNLSRFFEKVQSMSRDFQPDSAQETIQDLITSVDDLLKIPGDLGMDLAARHRIATFLLSNLEEVLRMLAKTMNGSFTYHSPGDTELSLVVQEPVNGNITVGQSHARMLLNWTMAIGARESGPTVVGILSSPNMQKLLANASFDLDSEKHAELEKIHGCPVRGAKVSLFTAVSSVFLSNRNTDKLDFNVTFAFSHLQETQQKLGPRQELICAFWKNDNSGSGSWATSGCWKLGSGNKSTTCQCNHLSSFAVLMAHYDVEDPKLALITKVGLALSLVCLLLCILTFLLVRPIQGSRTTVHLHLCICLFVGSAIFLAGIENEGGEVGMRCRLVAGLLHYCFLAAFCWMSLEGVELYFLVVRVFQGEGLKKRWLCLIGYGVPLLIVAISAAVNSQGYGRTLYCWLEHDKGFLWSFLGPVTFIVLCNAVIFVITVWKLTQKFSEINPDIKKLKKARVLTITAIAQLVVLGCTWVFGLFLFDPQSWVLSYTFTILNCLQGLFLFVLYCLLNKKVREEYRKWACMVAGNKYSEFTTSTSGSGSSHSQTRALRPSESGM
ncbi:CD97 antigen [Camelus dromedarius]|uniref:Adhesion G protein-coupled receptor E5 n=1 Tax=Camelus dromedarius TaxID=9838 RepID=A0A5N4CM73_CAMDR|nr:CD97 antigen [Camelus dromedarius]